MKLHKTRIDSVTWKKKNDMRCWTSYVHAWPYTHLHKYVYMCRSCVLWIPWFRSSLWHQLECAGKLLSGKFCLSRVVLRAILSCFLISPLYAYIHVLRHRVWGKVTTFFEIWSVFGIRILYFLITRNLGRILIILWIIQIIIRQMEINDLLENPLHMRNIMNAFVPEVIWSIKKKWKALYSTKSSLQN